jgi:pimeloyl-ACP methyl ester carboxylesterase
MQPAGHATAPNELHLRPCSAGKAQIPSSCGTYTVYEDRSARAGRILTLHFVVLRARRPSHRAIAWNPGGPGASAIASASAIADGEASPELTALRDRYDILLLDVRGTGLSAPQQCDFAPAAHPELYFLQMWPDRLVTACRARLAEKANLSLYSTPIAVDDLNDLRAALGYPKLVLDGGSYGTTLYLAYARQHPESVESIVLEGVSPPHFLINPLQDAGGAQASIDHLIAQCVSDVSCRKNFPAFGPHFEAIVQRFERGPVEVPVRNAATKRVQTVQLSKEVFADRLRQLLYNPAGAAYVPFIMERAYEKDYAPLAVMIDSVTQSLGGLVYGGLNLSVTCAEDIPFITEEDVARTSSHSFEGDLRVRAQQRACHVWNVVPVSTSFVEPVRSTAPVLMVSGSDDPATPPRYAREALQYLPNARILLIKGGSHWTDTSCADRLIVAFVNAGSAKGLDLSRCTGSFKRPPFATSMEGFND